MRKRNAAIIWSIIIGGGLVALFLIPKFTNPHRAAIARWKEVGVDCLPSHTRAALHIHPVFTVLVDGVSEAIPANIGIAPGCMAEIHTHDGSGTLHIESVRSDKTFRLKEWLTVWGKPFEREGFQAELAVNGAATNEGPELPLKEGERIELRYTKR